LGFEDDHVASAVTSLLDPSAKTAVAVSRLVSPSALKAVLPPSRTEVTAG